MIRALPTAPRGAGRLGAALRSTGSPGFTITEVLLVLLIMSGLLVAIAQVLNSARISRDTIHNIRETQLAGPAILDLIEQDLRGAILFNRAPDTYLRVKNNVRAGLDADRLDLVTTTNGRVREDDGEGFGRRADVNEVGYCLRPASNSDDFLELFRREDFGVDDEPFDGGRYTLLSDRIKAFEIEVWEEDGPEAEPLETWGMTDDGKRGLPRRIEVSLTLEIAPRLAREQLKIAPVEKRTITYKRLHRFREPLLLAQQLEPVPMVPEIKPPQVAGPGQGGGSGPSPSSAANPGGTPPADGGSGGSPFDGLGIPGGGGG